MSKNFFFFLGCQPRYLGDAFRGQAVMTCPIRPPPLVPRTRRDKAASTPPTPLENTTTSVCSSIASTAAVKLQGSTPPPLYPRRISPQFFALPNFSVPHSKPCDESPPEQKAPWSSTLTGFYSPFLPISKKYLFANFIHFSYWLFFIFICI